MSRSIRLLILAFASLTLLVGAACAGDGEDGGAEDGDNGAAATEAGTAAGDGNGGDGGEAGTVAVSMTEFAIAPASESVAAGEVTFEVSNDGALAHDFIVIQTDLDSGELPTTGVGADLSGVEVIDETGEFPAGEAQTLTVDLEAGHYVLLCNVAGHYAGGMHSNFTVD